MLVDDKRAMRTLLNVSPWFHPPPASAGHARETSAVNANSNLIGSIDSELRKPDRRIAALIHRALGSARTVLNPRQIKPWSPPNLARSNAPQQIVPEKKPYLESGTTYQLDSVSFHCPAFRSKTCATSPW